MRMKRSPTETATASSGSGPRSAPARAAPTSAACTPSASAAPSSASSAKSAEAPPTRPKTACSGCSETSGTTGQTGPTRWESPNPPSAKPCVQTSLDRCPELRKGAVTIRARRYPVAAAHGALYAGPEPTYLDKATIPLDNPKSRWLRAISLVRELNDCAVLPFARE
jgi:hypothetical protein